MNGYKVTQAKSDVIRKNLVQELKKGGGNHHSTQLAHALGNCRRPFLVTAPLQQI